MQLASSLAVIVATFFLGSAYREMYRDPAEFWSLAATAYGWLGLALVCLGTSWLVAP